MSTEKGVTVQIISVNGDRGEIVVFDGVTLDGHPCHVAVDRQTSLDLASRLVDSKKGATSDPCYVVVGSWQLRP
jgi:hypothetical protein